MKNLEWLVENSINGDASGDCPSDLQKMLEARKELEILKEDNLRPKIGVGVAIFCGHQVLLHKRAAGHSPNVWAFPGGHLEFGETFVDCALRETREECGTDLRVKVPRFWTAVNTVYEEEGKHYVVIFMYTHHTGGSPRNMEPTKGGEWRWFHVDALPAPLMMGISDLQKMGLLNPSVVERLVS